MKGEESEGSEGRGENSGDREGEEGDERGKRIESTVFLSMKEEPHTTAPSNICERRALLDHEWCLLQSISLLIKEHLNVVNNE